MRWFYGKALITLRKTLTIPRIGFLPISRCNTLNIKTDGISYQFDTTSGYLQKVIKALLPTRYESGTITMRDAMRKLLDETTQRFRLELKSSQFQKLSDFR